jgi:single-strand DNA-binding protein
MQSKNYIELIGYLGRDPEQKGKLVIFTVATTYKRKEGEPETSWHRCKAFGTTGEVAMKYLHKGSLVQVEGRMEYGSYDKEGVKVNTADVMVNSLMLLDRKPKDNDEPF